MTDKEAQLKAKLLKMRLARKYKDKRTRAQKLRDDDIAEYREQQRIDKNKTKLTKSQLNDMKDDIAERTNDSKTASIYTAKAKVKKLKKKTSIPDEIMQEASDAAGLNKNQSPSYIAQEHNHKISFRGHKIGGFKSASLDEQSGKYAKYWLLNAKETNGNGWGIAAHTAKENMKKFIGRPLVVTAQSWHGASEYGEEYEHPYLPTNDINAILNHQEKFRVGSIVDVFEDKQGDWFASVEMLPKFASSRLPPFCSPAIYQLDASEAEGQISKWEALHLAALTENPAYGARIALLKGTCVGTDNECKVQFKAAKQEPGIECPIKAKQKKVKAKLSKLKKKQKISKVKARLAVDTSKIKKKKYFNDKTLDRSYNVTMQGGIEDTDKTFDNPAKRKSPFENFQIRKKIDNSIGNNSIVSNPNKGTNDDKKASGSTVINSFKNKRMKKIAKVKARLAAVGLPNDFDEKENEDKILDALENRRKRPLSPLKKREKKVFDYADESNRNEFSQEERNQFYDYVTDGKKVTPTGNNAELSSTLKKKYAKVKARLAGIKVWGTDEAPRDDPRDPDLCLDCGEFNESHYVDEGSDELRGHPFNSPGGPQDKTERIIRKQNNPENKITKKDLKRRIASLGEQNMTYQESKKVKIHKKKHPEVRKAKSSVEDILRGKGRSVDGSHAQSTFLSSEGDFIGGGDKTEAHRSQVGLTDDNQLTDFQKETGLIRVQNFPINRAGDKKTSLGINSKVNKNQLKSIKDLETGGQTIGFSVGDLGKETTGEGYRDLTKILREKKFLG